MNALDIHSIHVLLIGAGNYPNWPVMNIPNVSANLEGLASLLSDPFYCGIPTEKITVIQDQDVETTNSAIQEFFDNIQTSNATVILYYSGHGLQSTRAMDDLFLATRNIRESRFEASSVRISELRKLFSDCVASKKILLLDCCYAGKISRGFMSDDTSENIAKLNEFDGTYIMAASSEFERARFDPDDPKSPTKFTGKFIEVIKNGIESSDEYCTLNAIYSQVRNAILLQKDAPRPVQIGQNNIGNFPIFKNKKFIEKIPPDEQAWKNTTLKNNVIAYNTFIEEFPQSKYKREAEKLIQTIEDEEAWSRAKDKDTIGGYRYYLRNYLKYAVEARQQLIALVAIHEEEIFWNKLDHQSIEALNDYLLKYPSGAYDKSAIAEINVLTEAGKDRLKLEAQKGSPEVEKLEKQEGEKEEEAKGNDRKEKKELEKKEVEKENNATETEYSITTRLSFFEKIKKIFFGNKEVGSTLKSKSSLVALIVLASLVAGVGTWLWLTRSAASNSSSANVKLYPVMDSTIGKWGLKDSASGKLMVPFQYDWADTSYEGIARVNVNMKFGFVDNKGKLITQLKYDFEKRFEDGMAFVQQDDNGGMIDGTGKEIIPFKAGNNNFSGGLFCVESGGKYGGVNYTGNIVTAHLYDERFYFSNGFAKIKLNGKLGVIDKTGKEIVAAKYDEIGEETSYFRDFAAGLEVVKRNNKYGYVDSLGNEIIPAKYDEARRFSEGLAMVKLNDKCGVIDKKGNEVVTPKYDFVDYFSDGFAHVRLNNLEGLIDQTGKEIVAPKYFHFEPFHEGFAAVSIAGGQLWGFIDTSGKELVRPKYYIVSDFSEGLARVTLNNPYRTGFIDKSGNEVIPLKYDNVEDFSEGLAMVRSGNKSGFIDHSGTLVIPQKYGQQMTPSSWDNKFYDGLARVTLDDKCLMIDKAGNEVSKKYDAIYFSEGLGWVELNKKAGLINKKGRELITPVKYDNIYWQTSSEGLVLADFNDKFAYIDPASGRQLSEFKKPPQRGN